MFNIAEESFYEASNESRPKIIFSPPRDKEYIWYNEYDECHRENDRPSVIILRNNIIFAKFWYCDGYPHRENDLPAEIWYRKDGLIRAKRWYQNEKLYRINGPAVIWYNEDGSISEEIDY